MLNKKDSAAGGCTCNEPFSVVLASDCKNAHSVTYESHEDSYGYTQTAPPQREVVSSSDALDKPHCDEC